MSFNYKLPTIALRASKNFSTDASLFYTPESATKPSPLKAGIIQIDDTEKIRLSTMTKYVIDHARPLYNLTNAVEILPTNRIKFGIKIAKGVYAQEEVKELEEAKLVKGEFEPVLFSLPKNVVHIGNSDEAAMQDDSDELKVYSLKDAPGAIANSKNRLIAKTLLSGSQSDDAAQDWSDKNSNPYLDINTAIDAIEDEECGQVNIMVANRKVWTAFFSNLSVKGHLIGVNAPTYPTTFPIPGLQGVTGILDNHIKEDTAVLACRSKYAILAQGPVTAEQYRDVPRGFDGAIIRDYMQTKIGLNNAGYLLQKVLTN